MKFIIAMFIALLPALAMTAIAGYMIVHDIKYWGWVLAVAAIMSNVSLKFTNDDE